jgi:hypothetical protein
MLLSDSIIMKSKPVASTRLSITCSLRSTAGSYAIGGLKLFAKCCKLRVRFQIIVDEDMLVDQD